MKALLHYFCVISLTLIFTTTLAYSKDHNPLEGIDVFEDGYNPLSDENTDYYLGLLACPTTTITANASATVTVSGNNILANDDCTLRTAQDYVIQVNIPDCGDWRFSACQNGGTVDYDVFLFLGTSCCGAEIGSNDDGCGCGPSELTVNNIEAGTYFLAVEAFNNTSSCSYPDNLGNFTIAIDKVGDHDDIPTTETFGTNEWLVYGYEGDNYNTLRGFYNAGNALSQNSASQFGTGSSPSNAASWTGCNVSNNNHSYRYLRRGFPCGVYQIDIPNHDDYYYLEIDGTTVAFQNSCCGPDNNVWTGVLDANSEVLFGLREFTGGSQLQFTLTDVSTALNPGTHNTTTINACEGYNPSTIGDTGFTGTNQEATGGASSNSSGGGTITGGSSSYQWQLNGTDIGGETGVSYNPPQLDVIGSYVYRREVTDACGDIAYTSTKTINIVADPTVSIATSANTICPGGGVILTATPTGGGAGTCDYTWESSPDDVTWTALATTTGTTYSVTSINANTYYRVVIDCSGSGCTNGDSNSVLVEPEDNTDPIISGCPSNITVNNTAGLCTGTASWTPPTATDECPLTAVSAGGFDFTYIGEFDGNFYYYSNNNLVPSSGSDADQQAAFASAHAAAVSMNGILTTVNSTEENDFISNNTAGNTLIGYTDEAAEGSFGWIGGGGTGYTNWNGGEPNNVGGEDYVELQNGSGGWNDIDIFNSPVRFVVEVPGPFPLELGTDITSTHAPGATFPVGTTTVTYTATDQNGNDATCSFTVTVNDTENPQITCPANIAVNNDATTCGAVVTYTAPIGTDNCPGQSTIQTAGLASGATFPVGTTTNTFEVTDAAGLTATCSFDVVVTDVEDPEITCPVNIAMDSDPGICGAVVTYTAPVGTDNCPGPSTVQTAGLASGATFPVGTTTNTFEVTDAAGLTATCSFDVVVTDVEDPVVNCPANILIDVVPGVCDLVVNYSVTSSDNCPGETIAQTAGLPSGATFPVGTTTNTFEVTDAAGLTSTCSFDVEITVSGASFSFTNPIPTACTGDGIYTNQTGGSPIVATNPGDSGIYSGLGVTDNGNGSFDFDPSIPGLGTHNIQYTYNDGAGCSYSITEQIEVTESPIASLTCPNPLEKDCLGPFNCSPVDLNPATVAISSGSISGSATAYMFGDPSPGGDLFIDFPNVPKDTELELIYTITTTDGCTSTASCTFEVASKKSNAGKF